MQLVVHLGNPRPAWTINITCCYWNGPFTKPSVLTRLYNSPPFALDFLINLYDDAIGCPMITGRVSAMHTRVDQGAEIPLESLGSQDEGHSYLYNWERRGLTGVEVCEGQPASKLC